MTMITADSVSGSDGPTPAQVRRGRRTALLLFAVGFGPMILATVMYYTGWLNPAGHTNEGVLIKPVVPVQELQLMGADGQPLADRFGPDAADPQWQMIVVAGACGEGCEQLLFRTRQVNIALGKNAPRVSRAAYLESVPATLESRWSSDYGRMERLQPLPETSPAWPEGVGPEQAPGILVVDPMGNVMMRYDSRHTGKQMLEDLKHLLKLSQVG